MSQEEGISIFSNVKKKTLLHLSHSYLALPVSMYQCLLFLKFEPQRKWEEKVMMITQTKKVQMMHGLSNFTEKGSEWNCLFHLWYISVPVLTVPLTWCRTDIKWSCSWEPQTPQRVSKKDNEISVLNLHAKPCPHVTYGTHGTYGM